MGSLPTIIIALRISEALGTEIFPCLVLGPIMTRTDHDMLTKFLEIKPHTFVGSEIEDKFEFIVDCYKILYKICVVE